MPIPCQKNIRSLLACAAIVLIPSSMVFADGPVQTYQRGVSISRSEGLISTRGFVPAGDFREGRLLNAVPYPMNRTDDPRREQLGRLWHPRTPVGSRSIINELPQGFPGAAGYGATSGQNEDVIFVRSETGLPNIAISPFDTIDDFTFQTIEEQIPFIGRTRTMTKLRKDEVLTELREAKNQWLREQGYIQKVRTHVNAATLVRDRDPIVRDASTIEPRAIIRKHEPGEVTAQAGNERTGAMGEITRISSPLPTRRPIVVVRRNSDADGEIETAQADQSPE